MTTHQHILALTMVDENYIDGLGTEFPTDGVFRSDAYEPDDEIGHGIWGFEWGKVDPGSGATNGVIWAVKDDNWLHKLGYNIVKFRRGTVLYAGPLEKCYNVLSEEEQEPSLVYSRSPEASK